MKNYTIDVELNEVNYSFTVTEILANGEFGTRRVFGSKADAQDYIFDMIAVDKIVDVAEQNDYE